MNTILNISNSKKRPLIGLFLFLKKILGDFDTPLPFRNLYTAPEKILESAYQFKIQQGLNYFHSEYSFIISSTRLLMASLTFCDSPLYSGFKPK